MYPELVDDAIRSLRVTIGSETDECFSIPIGAIVKVRQSSASECFITLSDEYVELEKKRYNGSHLPEGIIATGTVEEITGAINKTITEFVNQIYS